MTIDLLVARDFGTLFAGRADAYGTEEGGCEWNEEPPCNWGPDYEDRIANHLMRGPCLGIYPLLDNGTVRWGCVDFDEGDEISYIHARNLEVALAQFQIQGWVECSRSKGYHVWVFASEGVDARIMREALLGACQVVDAPLKEINPKQVELPEGSVGNYVRLPYPGNRTPGRQEVLDPLGEVPLEVDEFVRLAMRFRSPSERFRELQGYYTPPKPPAPPRRPFIASQAPPSGRLEGLAYTIWRDGPLDGSDRSETLWKLCCLMREGGGITYHEALDLLIDADRRWGKFWNRRGGEQQLANMLAKAWG